MKRQYEDLEYGAIGIGAMIVFIALILVAAVASAVIIQTGEKLQQNAQQTGDDTQREIGGKITINSAYILGQAADAANTNNVMRVYFESAPGSGVIATTNIAWQVSCSNSVGITTGYQFTAGTFGDGDLGDGAGGGPDGLVTAGDIPRIVGDVYTMDSPTYRDETPGGAGTDFDGTADVGEIDNSQSTINPGDAYVVDIQVDGTDPAGGDDCAFGDVGVNGEITFWIHVEGGGSTYETILITDTSVGALLV